MMANIITAVLKGVGGGSVMIDDEPINGVVSVKIEQTIGNAPKVIIEIVNPNVIVKVETDDVTVVTQAANGEGKPE
jgi:hypothetical protein